MVVQVLAQSPNHFELFFDRQPIDSGLNNVPHANLVHGNEAVIIHVCEESHDKLAVHSVRNTTMSGDRLAKVLDLESPLEARGEETTKRRDQRSKRRENQDMELNGLDVECRAKSGPLRNVVRLRDKSGVGRAFQSGQDVGTEVIDRADEILVAHQDIGHEVAETNGAKPSAQESFDRLLGRQLDQLRATKGKTADVGKNIVRDHQGCRQEEPNHTLQDVIHDKVRLHDDQIERHMCPGPLGELEAVVALLERCDEKDET